MRVDTTGFSNVLPEEVNIDWVPSPGAVMCRKAVMLSLVPTPGSFV